MKKVLGRQDGQTVTEYLMILGVLTAIIISLSALIIPTIREVVITLVTGMACGLATAGGCS